MNEERQPNFIDPQLEARLVALVLGEASDFERDELNHLIEQHPELAEFLHEMHTVHGLLREIGAGDGIPKSDDWKLPTEKREILLSTFAGEATAGPSLSKNADVKAESTSRRRRLMRNIASVAAVFLVVAFGISVRQFNALSRRTASSMPSADSSRLLERAEIEEASGVSQLWYGGGVSTADPFDEAMDSEIEMGLELDSESEMITESLLAMPNRANESPAVESPAEAKPQSASARKRLSGPASEPAPTSPPPSPSAAEDQPIVNSRDLFADNLDAVKTGQAAAQQQQQQQQQGRALSGMDEAKTATPSSQIGRGSDASRSGRAMMKGLSQSPPGPSQTFNSDLGAKLERPNAAINGPSPGDMRGQLAEKSAGIGGESFGRGEEELGLGGFAVGGLSGGGFGGGGGAMGGGMIMGGEIAADMGMGMADRSGVEDFGEFDIDDAEIGGLALEGKQSSSTNFGKANEKDKASWNKSLNGISTANRPQMPPSDPFSPPMVTGGVFKQGEAVGGIFQDDSIAQRKLGEADAEAIELENSTTREFKIQSLKEQRPESLKAKKINQLSAANGRSAIDRLSDEIEKQALNRIAGEGNARGRRFELEGGQAQSALARQRGQTNQKGGDSKEVSDSKKDSTDSTTEILDAYGAGNREQLYRGGPKEQAKSRAKKSAAPTGLNEKSARQEPFSTFSLHVSDVSFKLARSALANGSWPAPEKVRIEEFVNAFDYGDPMPSQSEKVACRIEQSVHPFLQQRNLMRVSMRTAASGRSGNIPLRLTLLVDNSGSMERVDRQQTLRRAFAALADQLQPNDQVTLLSFARRPRLLADKVKGSQAKQLIQIIENLPSEGGTNIESALTLAFEKAIEQKLDQAQNRIILLTDGAVNLGNANPQSLTRIVTQMRGSGIAFDAAGISADGLNDTILEALTRQGDGRYYLLDSLEAVDDGFARQIAGALRPAAKNVKVQVQFNPKRVDRYKLLGYEKHRLKKEDFRNDKVDAAEMAAEEAGVAVYQFEAKPDGEGDIGMVSVRFRDLSTGQMIENTWPILYEADALRLDQADGPLRLASSAALLAAKLRSGALAESVDLRDLSNLVAGLPEQIRDTPRVQELLQMIQQARQLSER